MQSATIYNELLNKSVPSSFKMASAKFINKIFPLVGTLLLCMVAVAATQTRFIDGDEMESIAQTACSRSPGSYIQLANISTIKQLATFFENLPPGHKLEACRNKNKDALKLLVEIISVRNDNVCSDQKISLIEKFHHSYISQTKKDKKQQQLDKTLEASKLYKNFFYHYVMKVALICKDSLIDRYKEVSSYKATLEDRREYSNMFNFFYDTLRADTFLADFARQLGSTSGSFKTYGEISLLWNYIDRLPIKKNNSYISQEGKRIAFETRDAQPMKDTQKGCLTRLKPIYGALALPVIRLIDLGYYLDNESFASELADLSDLWRLMRVAQMCEFILPIRVISNSNLTDGEMVLITKEQANKIPLDNDEKVEPAVIPDDHHNSLSDSDTLESATPDNAHRFVKSVKANIKAREKTLHTLFSKMASILMDKAKSMFGKMFYSRKNQDIMTNNPGDGSEKSDLFKGAKSLLHNVFEVAKSDVIRHYHDCKNNPIIFVIYAPLLLILWLFRILIPICKGILPALLAIVEPTCIKRALEERPNRSLVNKLV